MATEEVEYIEPTQEHVGQVVEVRQAEMSTYRTRKLLAVLPHPIKYRFVCQDSVDAVSSSHWMHARILSPLTYAERQAKCGLKVGDRVRFMRAWDSGELGTHLRFYEEMKPLINQVGVVSTIEKSIRVEFDNDYWWLPYFVLEKIVDREPSHADSGAIVYVNGTPHCTYKLVLTFLESDNIWRGVVKQNDTRYVYELSTLRIKG